MSRLRRLPALRWLLPLVALVVFVGGGSAVAAIAASGSNAPAPPPVDQLLADVAQAHVDGLSGTIVQDSNLGLPELPGMGGQNSADLQSLVSGSHTLRVWYAGPRHVRMSLLGQMGESDVVRNGQDLWVWASSSKSATHRTLPQQADRHPSDSAPMSLTPQAAARRLLHQAGPTTKVATGPNTTVADRPAWQLVVTPRSSTTLVGSVHVAVDTATHLPLRVQVFPRGSTKPALDVGYTSFDPTRPSSSVFGFNPPAGTTVTQKSGPLLGGMLPDQLLQRLHDGAMTQKGSGTSSGAGAPKVVGSGWDTVVVAQAPTHGAGKAGLGGLLRTLTPVHGAWGSGHLLSGTLFSAVITDDGRLAVGAVPPTALYAALGS